MGDRWGAKPQLAEAVTFNAWNACMHEHMCDAQALQWVADNVQYPAIVSTSVAGEHSAAVNQAVQSLINDYGITVIAAAGES